MDLLILIGMVQARGEAECGPVEGEDGHGGREVVVDHEILK